MRIRTIKPEFFSHEKLFDTEKKSKLPLRLVYIGLWCAADREGRFKWEPRRLKTTICPYDDINFEACLEALREAEFVVRYGEKGEFACIPSFTLHQRINCHESKSLIPCMHECAPHVHAHACTAQDECMHGTGGEDASRERKGREGKGKERNSTRASRCTRDELDSFCRENELFPRDSEYLWNHWESNGWTNGGRPIKDWKATVKKWKAIRVLPTTRDKTVEDFWPDEDLQITFYPPSPPFELPEGMRPDGSLIPEVMFRKIREQREREEQGLD